MPFFKDKYSLLMIDDDEEDFMIVRDIIGDASLNATIHWEPNVEQAKEKIRNQDYDLYFIDQQMGKYTGLEIIRELTAEGCKKPMILLTGMGNRQIDLEALKYGAADYVSKNQLSVEIVDRILRHNIQRYEFNLEYDRQMQLFKNYFDQSINPLVVLDSNLNIIQANTAFKKTFGERAYENLELYFDEHQAFLDFKNQLIGNQTIENFECQLTAKEQERMDFMLNCSLIQSGNGFVNLYQCAMNDITAKRKAEKELSQAQQFNLTGRMARIMAHEVRNPLTNIGLAVDQLIDEVHGENQEELLEYLDIIKRNGNRINSLINDLLKSTKDATLKLMDYNIEDVVLNAVHIIQDRAVLKDIELIVRISDVELTSCKMDPEKFEMALVNIMVNAIEAMEDREEKELTIQGKLKENRFEIQIHDTGVGMDGETVQKLFEPFYTKRPGGMGLGMTAVKNIFNLHKCDLRVESKPGVGTSFFIEIPLNQEHEQSIDY